MRKIVGEGVNMLAYEATDFSYLFLSLGKESNLQIRSKRSTFFGV